MAALRSALAANVADFTEFSLRNASNQVLLPGRLYVPPEASNPNASRPFIVFLHGGGESGSNNLSQINVNIDNLLAEAKRRGAFLYAPQTPNTWSDLTLTNRVMNDGRSRDWGTKRGLRSPVYHRDLHWAVEERGTC